VAGGSPSGEFARATRIWILDLGFRIHILAATFIWRSPEAVSAVAETCSAWAPRSGPMTLVVGFNPRYAMTIALRRVATIESIENISFIVIDTIQFQHRNVFIVKRLLLKMFALIPDVLDNARDIRFADAENPEPVLPSECSQLGKRFVHTFRRLIF
jgi:hypothetical protein